MINLPSLNKPLIEKKAYVDVDTEAWLQYKAGRISSSGVHFLMGVKGIGKTGKAYAFRIFLERLRNVHMKSIDTFYTRRGHELEGDAAEYLEKQLDVKLYTAKDFFKLEEDFIIDEKTNSGSTPDGVFTYKNDIWLFENKARGHGKTKDGWLKHYTSSMDVDRNHGDYWQLQHQLYCSKAKGTCYCNFNPDVPEQDRLLINKIYPANEDIEMMIDRIKIAEDGIAHTLEEYDHSKDGIKELQNARNLLYSLVN